MTQVAERLGSTAREQASSRSWPVVTLSVVLSASSAAALALVAGRLAAGPTPVLALLLPLALLPVVLWKRPAAGLLLLLAGVVLVEQFGYQVGPREGALTARIPLFRSVAPGALVTPAEVLLAGVFIVWTLHCVRDRRRMLHRTPLATRIFLLVAMAVFYFAFGVARGGDLAIAVFELRPFLFLLVAYVLAASLLAHEKAVATMLWIFVIGSAMKAVYGVLIFLSIRFVQPRPEAVLAHEESFFFGVYVFLTIGAWLFGLQGRLRTVATALLPVVLLADMVNSRRTAWAILIFGLLLLLAIAYRALPRRRHVLTRVTVVAAVLSAVYLPLFWNSGGTLAQPARAVRSAVAPDARDEMSNEYRMLEDLNLEYNIRARSSTGSGFGIPIDYVVPIVDLTDIASLIAYVPHNGLYWVWMRMGLFGQVLLWLVIAEALATCVRLARQSRGQSALLGAVTACAVVGWVIMGETDYGLYWTRLMLCMGLLLGVVDGRLRAAQSSVEHVRPAAAPAGPLLRALT